MPVPPLRQHRELRLPGAHPVHDALGHGAERHRRQDHRGTLLLHVRPDIRHLFRRGHVPHHQGPFRRHHGILPPLRPGPDQTDADISEAPSGGHRKNLIQAA